MTLKIEREKMYEAILVIVTGFLVLYFVFNTKLLLIIAVSVGVIGIFVKPLAKILAMAWLKLGDVLGFVISKIVLGIMFFFFLVPIALLHNIFNKNSMRLKNNNTSLWINRNHRYQSNDLKNIW